jgi:hypothetical protein
MLVRSARAQGDRKDGAKERKGDIKVPLHRRGKGHSRQPKLRTEHVEVSKVSPPFEANLYTQVSN